MASQHLKLVNGADSRTISDLYTKHSRPGQGSKLSAIGLDVAYHRAEKNSLYYFDQFNTEVEILDAVQGFGSGLFGHNYPPFVSALKQCLDSAVPFMNQLSVRTGPAFLAEQLNSLYERSTGHQYITQFLNTGSEAVERAIKFSMYRHHNVISQKLKKIDESLVQLRAHLLSTKALLTPSQKDRLEEFLGSPVSIIDTDLLDIYLAKVKAVLSENTAFIALNGSYHGQTLGSLQLTSNILGQAYVHKGLLVHFCDASDPNSLQRLSEKAALSIPLFALESEQLALVEMQVNTIAGLILEPIQGEGGVVPISSEFFHAARNVCTENGITFIVDEVQTGCGRTGRFICSERFGVHADCYLLGKSLGGGLVKISACSFEESIYLPEFDLKIGSTFAEDELSSAVAREVVTLLSADSPVLSDIRLKGHRLLDELKEVADHFPGVVKEVRGDGLLIGLEFNSHINNHGFMFRALSEADMFAYGVASYLFYEHQIRVAATTGNNHTIRIQPSAFISDEQISSLVHAISRVCEIIYKLDGYEFTQHLIHKKGAATERDIVDCRESERDVISKKNPELKSVSFIVTPSKVNDLVDVDPTLRRLSPSDARKLWERFYDVIGGVTVQQTIIRSKTGSSVNFRLASLPFDVQRVMQLMFSGDNEVMNEVIEQDIDRMVSEGFQYYGLGAFTSIVSKNGERFVRDDINITTGNALTVYMGIQSILDQARAQGIDVATSKSAVFGALGNIGSVYAHMMSDESSHILLVGKHGSDKRLKSLAIEIYEAALDKLRNGTVVKGVAKTLSDMKNSEDFLKPGYDGEALFQEMSEASDIEPPISISTSPTSLRDAHLILSCTNTPNALITPDVISDGNVAICDVSFPPDVHTQVREMENVGVVSGGLVSLPYNQDLKLRGSPELPRGMVYACVAETLVLGLAGHDGHFSYGPITKEQVLEIGRLAEQHGFVLGKSLENKY